jgi:exonuclease III
VSAGIISNSYYFKNLEKSKEFLEKKLPSKKVVSSYVNRVCIAALPFLSLYSPFGRALSIFSASIRIYSKYEEFPKDGSKFSKGWSLVKMGTATLSLANCFFNHKKALLMTNANDVLESLWDVVSKEGAAEKSLSLLSAINSSTYMGVLLCPSIEVMLLSLFVQVLFELGHAAKEWQKGDRQLEVGARLLMAGIRGRQTLSYARVFWKKHQAKIVPILNRERERIAEMLHRFDSMIASPFWWYTEKVVRMTRAIQLGVNGQCSSRVGEIATRVFYGVLGIPMLSYALATSLPELLVRSLAKGIAPDPFFYLKGNVEEKTKHNGRVSILTMNVCFVAGGFAELFAGGIPNWKNRIDSLTENILKQDLDIVCLQEVNDVNASIALHERLKGNYAHFYHNIGAQIFSQNSGHFIASKYAINDPNFIPFNSGTGLQAMVNKGLFTFDVSCSDRILANISAVHLSPSKQDLDPTRGESLRRSLEIELVVENIRKKAAEHINALNIFLGDFNLSFDSTERKNSPISSGVFIDPYNQNRTEIKLDEGTCATENMRDAHKKGEEKGWLKEGIIFDYNLVWNNLSARAAKMSSTLFRGFFSEKAPCQAYSDHNGVVLNIEMPSEP